MEQEKLLTILSDIKGSVDTLSSDMQVMKSTVATLSSDMQDMKAMKSTVDALSNDMRCVKLTIENDIFPRIRTMEECFLSTHRQLPDYMKKTEQHEVRIDMLQKAVQKHSLKLQNIS